jgi:Na+-driven multidrug efflux pump
MVALGIAVYFASQGAGQVLLPVLAGTARLAVVLLGALAASLAGALTLEAIFWLIAAGMLTVGGLSAWSLQRARWVE